MDLNWLRDFITLAEQRNFSRAAEERNVSQPALSRRIQAIEAEVGAPLINRETLPLTLTRAGEVFLGQITPLLIGYDDTLERCRTIAATDQEKIRFATSHALYLTHYPRLIAPLVQQQGIEADLNSTTWTADQFVSALQHRYCDVILTYWHPSMEFLSPLHAGGCDYVTIAQDRLIPVGRTSRDDGQTELSLKVPRRKSEPPVPMLAYGPGTGLRCVVEHLLGQTLQRAALTTVNQNSLASSIKDMVMAGFGMGWIPSDLCRSELQQGCLTQLDNTHLTADLEVRLYRERSNQKPSVTRFWDAINGIAA